MEESSGREPQCARCQFLGWRCTRDCLFAPFFSAYEPKKQLGSNKSEEIVRAPQPALRHVKGNIRRSSTVPEEVISEHLQKGTFTDADEGKQKCVCNLKSLGNKFKISKTSWTTTHKELPKKIEETGRNEIEYSADLEEKSTFQVTRDGCKQEIPIYDLLPGDVIHPNSGDKIPADRVFISRSSLVKQESSLQSNQTANVHSENPFLFFSGAELQHGSGKVLVTAVGKELPREIKETSGLNQITNFPWKIRDDIQEISTYDLLPADILMIQFIGNGIIVFGLKYDGRSTVSGVREELPAVSNQSQPPPAATDIFDDLMRILVAHLCSDSIGVKKQGVMLIRYLAKDSDKNRQKIAEAGAIQPLILLVSSSDPELQEYAVTAILNLSLCKENKGLMVSRKLFEAMVKALKSGTPWTKANAACALFHLLQAGDDYSKETLGWLGAIPLLVELLKSGDLQGNKDAATALFSLCSVDKNKRRAVQAGIMKPLVKFMKEFNCEMVEKAAFVLSVLVSSPKAIPALVEEGGVTALVKVIELGWLGLMEIAITMLLRICEDCEYRSMVSCQGDVLIPRLRAVPGVKQKADKLMEFLGHPRSANTSDHVPGQSD